MAPERRLAAFKRAALAGLIPIIAGAAHQTVSRLKGPIDLAFIDADKPGYPDYYEALVPKLSERGLIWRTPRDGWGARAV